MDNLTISTPGLSGDLYNISTSIYLPDTGTGNLSVQNTSEATIDNSYDKDEYISSYLGDRHTDMPSLAILTTVYVLIFISGTVGNMCTCIVIAKNRNMHTATNYYLFSLAVSDLSTLFLALPPELYTFWQAYPWIFGETFCIIKSFISETTAYASSLTITAFTMERYAAICHPMRFQKLSNLSRAIRVIIVIWILSTLFALPFPIHARTFYALSNPITSEPFTETLVCNVPVQWRQFMQYMFQVSTFAFFVFPMAVITVMYILIGITLYKSEIIGLQQKYNPTVSWGNKGKKPKQEKVPFDTSKARKSVVKMLVAVVVAFFACWAPFHCQRLWTIYMNPEKWTPELHALQTHLFYLSGALYFFSATVNPILYNLMSKKYRQAFKKTLCRCIQYRNETRKSMFGSSYSPRRDRRVTCSYSKVTKSTRNDTTLKEPETMVADISV